MMTRTISAVFDGKVLHPDETIPLAPNTRVEITLRMEKPSRKKKAAATKEAAKLRAAILKHRNESRRLNQEWVHADQEAVGSVRSGITL